MVPEEAEEVTQNLGFRVRGLQGLAFSLKPCSEKAANQRLLSGLPEVVFLEIRVTIQRLGFMVQDSGFKIRVFTQGGR